MSFLTVANIIFWGTALLTALAVFPFCRWAVRSGLVFQPSRFSRYRKKPVPVGGGMVIFTVLITTISGLVFFKESFDFSLVLTPKLLIPLLIVSPLVLFFGFINDRYGMNGGNKLLLQILAASIIVGFARRYSHITLFGADVELYQLFYPLAVLWLVGMMNAIRLLDGVDGVAVTVSFFTVASTAVIAFINQHYEIALISIGLAGCLLGFFVYNRPPSKIHLGNTGSMILGLFLGLLTFRAAIVSDRDLSICAPLAVMLIPFIDISFACVRRLNLRRSLFTSDRGHIHHILASRFSNGYAVLLIMSLLVIPGCCAAILSTYYGNDWIAVGVVGAIIVTAFITDLSGHNELRIMYGRLKGRIRKTFYVEKYMTKNGEFYRIQGTGPWRTVWNQMVRTMHNRPCRKLRLNINIPGLNEDFFAEWENMKLQPEGGTSLSCFAALLVDGEEVGKIRFIFETDNRDEAMKDIDLMTTVCESCIRCYLETGETDVVSLFPSVNFGAAA